MGTLRFLLALSVVFFHTTPLFGFPALNGFVAVNAFFIISGFYMSLILNEKYIKKSGSYFLFITNRILRIYPLYLITLFAIFFFSLIKFSMGLHGPENFYYRFFIFFSHTPGNVIPLNILPDFLNYIIRNITLVFTTDWFFLTSKNPSTLILYQAWSLQREMFFYLLAPFFARRNFKVLLLIFVAYIILFFYWVDPHNILPKNLLLYNCLGTMFFFFLGMFSYKAYVFLRKKTIPPFVIYLTFLGVIIYTVFYTFIPQIFHLGINLPTDINYCLIIAIAIPFLFMFGQKLPIDKLLGDLSYPIFITHVFFIKVLDNIPGIPQGNAIFTLLTTGCSLVASWIFVKFVDRRINEFRQKRVKKVASSSSIIQKA
jgi:peptidoglycan/LPS O-acetylase OafA/YrhL